MVVEHSLSKSLYCLCQLALQPHQYENVSEMVSHYLQLRVICNNFQKLVFRCFSHMNLNLIENHLLVTVFSIELTSALNVPPQMRSSHVFDCGKRSATRAHPINSQSLIHEFGVPCVPPPTIAFTATLLLPESVNERDRFESMHLRKLRGLF